MSEKKQLRIATRNSGFIDPENIDSYIAAGGYQALGKCLGEMTPQELIEEIKKAVFAGGVALDSQRESSGVLRRVILPMSNTSSAMPMRETPVLIWIVPF